MVVRSAGLSYLSDLFSSQGPGQIASNMTLYMDNAPHVAGSVIVIMILGFTMYALRVYTRLKVAAWGIDDWFMTAAIVILPCVLFLTFTDLTGRRLSLYYRYHVSLLRSMVSVCTLRNSRSQVMKSIKRLA